MASLSLTQLRKTFGDTTIIGGADLHVRSGEFVVFVGPSGCGKSTLLRMIAGLEDISGGQLHIDGVLANDLPPAKRGIAMVFQSYALYPHMTVFDNMAFGLTLANQSRQDIEQRVTDAARILHIDHLLQRLPKALSGGQRQRVAIGRAIVRQPKVFLFDEPLSNLDAALRVQMRIELAKLHRELGSTMIYVTHDQVEAMTLGDRIVVLNGGRIEQVGTPLTLYHTPANKFVASFLGSPTMNFLPAQVDSYLGDRLKARLRDGNLVELGHVMQPQSIGTPIELGIRPEHIQQAASGEPGIALTVDAVEHLGEATLVYGRLGQHADELVVKLDGECRVAPGNTLALQFDPQHVHAFADNGASLLYATNRAVSVTTP
ncbi:sn-glycerol-3-phosphate ABC transporter ATP-binding protein UgpC [Chitinivorax sp. B]|uniref:ABC transporter ATP-binding protein n=1 Tax=Chitinivorax sp. B TaxID=2502235 RepID=UPI0010F5E7BC|nr:sn-glycerol-3-phosphate ABC transporter ATP-binding protein UgpC [Chitinivorax sp. B]